MNRLHQQPQHRHGVLKTVLGIVVGLVIGSIVGAVAASTASAAPPIERVLPPAGMELPADVRDELVRQTKALRTEYARTAANDPLSADVEVYVKALELALEFHEFYGPKDVDKAKFAIAEARRRLAALPTSQAPTPDAKGLTVRGYRSRVDGSAQPYGVVLPPGLDANRPAPLYVWLHGRGDKQTDLHFLHERHHSVGQIAPANAIVIHPFGRHCLGFKSAGEFDVLEAVAHAQTQYSIDPDRIVLIGFSMGGAGAWHLGAHYADRWCAVSPGAGFAETARYVRLAPDKFPPTYVQTLWGCYDVPAYVRNLFNVPVIAYSGEKDKQIQAARVMEEAFQTEGRTLRHLIGPGVEHKYEPATLKQLLAELDAIVGRGRDPRPARVSLQTRTLRYGKQYWVEALGLERHWRDSRIDAERTTDGVLQIQTRNVSRFRATPPGPVSKLVVDGQAIDVAALGPQAAGWTFVRSNPSQDGAARNAWQAEATTKASDRPLRKEPGLQGPIDDAFLEPFVFVLPSGQARHPAVQQWVESESKQAMERWTAVCRGRPLVKLDHEVTADDLATKHLVLWGDAESNQVLRRVVPKLPIHWSEKEIAVGEQTFASPHHVALAIYPNPENPRRYVVLNSGLTFREAHDRTNSQQNPKLPDWTVVDVREAPSGERPGQIAAAGFFDEHWQVENK
ncbi:MAG: alpha/beta hydrolase-fold protein [Pirellulales bacterium]